MRERVILVESNTSGTGRHFISAARRLGLEPILLAEDPSRYPYIQQDQIEVIQHKCMDNLDGLQTCIDRLAQRFKIAGIYSSSEYFIETAAESARRRSLPGPDPHAVQICRNKWEQRNVLQKAGVGIPSFIRVRSPLEALQALEVICLPVVLKPILGTGSVGVRLCRNRAEVENHAAALLAVQTNERGMPIPQEILVEE